MPGFMTCLRARKDGYGRQQCGEGNEVQTLLVRYNVSTQYRPMETEHRFCVLHDSWFEV